MRLLNRRRGDASARDPSVASLIRQLRSNAQDFSDDVKKRRFKLRLTATIELAKRQRLRQTAAILAKLDKDVPESALTDPRAARLIDQALMAATASLPVAT